MTKEDFIKEGFTVIGEEAKENKLLAFLKEHYPSVIKDNEINLQELKAIAGLPIDEKVNGYGLNFVGRNFARAKYAQKTQKELRLNTTLSKNIDTTQNLVLKGDNLDCLKILKNYYSGKIKCIYIDPPYNTDSDEFVYPDKFDKEELEVLGLANLSDEDFARMDFSFKTKKSHNGWLSFMYPRLLLARDLLSKDGVIFISIDDNEQANLKLLCDDVFGEENFVACLPTIMNLKGNNDQYGFSGTHEYTLVYAKNLSIKNCLYEFSLEDEELEEYNMEDEIGMYKKGAIFKRTGANAYKEDRPNLFYPIWINPEDNCISLKEENGWIKIEPKVEDGKDGTWRWSKEKLVSNLSEIIVIKNNGEYTLYKKQRLELSNGIRTKKPKSIFYRPEYSSGNGTKQIKELFSKKVFDNPKPVDLIKDFLEIGTKQSDIILDFFAGSGTTGHAVMQLNAEDGGNRKFILVQIDEPIKEDKPAYKFCLENNLPPVISSITIERLKRAGDKIKKEIEEENKQAGIFEENKKQVPDIGFKVFDTVDAPKLTIDETGQIHLPELYNDPISRIYNMIFTVGLDEPTQVPEEVVKDCIYKIGNHYYITNSEKISKEDFANAIKNGKVFIDGWTASLNATLQHYKEDVKIVF
jgi:adenine-specific DNA-methyltransferase